MSGEPQPKIKLVANDLVTAVRGKLEAEKGNGQSQKWALLEELRFGTGFAGYPNRRETREETEAVASRIDLFAICLWPSRNFLRRAYEVKVSRSDLRAEYRNPRKRAPWLEVVNEFYIVAPVGIATPEEHDVAAPECGLILYDPTKVKKPKPGDWSSRANSGLRTVYPAMELGGGEPSWRLVASILRAASRNP